MLDQAKLGGVSPALIGVVTAAYAADPYFIVGEGVRSDADQYRDWVRGASRLNGIALGQVVNGIAGTGRGNHQPNLTDHLGHAVDLPPIIGGRVWGGPHASGDAQWEGCYRTALAMRAAAIAKGVRIRWGGDWDTPLNDLPGDLGVLKAARARYVSQFSAAHGRSPLADGPHFELLAP